MSTLPPCDHDECPITHCKKAMTPQLPIGIPPLPCVCVAAGYMPHHPKCPSHPKRHREIKCPPPSEARCKDCGSTLTPTFGGRWGDGEDNCWRRNALGPPMSGHPERVTDAPTPRTDELLEQWQSMADNLAEALRWSAIEMGKRTRPDLIDKALAEFDTLKNNPKNC